LTWIAAAIVASLEINWSAGTEVDIEREKAAREPGRVAVVYHESS